MISEEALLPLAEEMKCSICLSLMKTPIARLASCCHSFCRWDSSQIEMAHNRLKRGSLRQGSSEIYRICIMQALNVEAKCPLCKHPASRRDVLRSVPVSTSERLSDMKAMVQGNFCIIALLQSFYDAQR